MPGPTAAPAPLQRGLSPSPQNNSGLFAHLSLDPKAAEGLDAPQL